MNYLKFYLLVFLSLITVLVLAQNAYLPEHVEIYELDNSIFKKDKYWRGADGAASVDLENGKILWLFSDTFIDPRGNGKRKHSKMIRNSIAVQEAQDTDSSQLSFFYGGSGNKPKSFFELPGDNWFWTGHGIMIRNKLVIFLIEETKVEEGFGFQAIGWYLAIIDNPIENPSNWKVDYIKGPETFGVIPGSSAVLKDSIYVYVFGVKEPSTHEVYLFRFKIDQFVEKDISGMEWWVKDTWTTEVIKEPVSSTLFIGQTEFSVHYDNNLKKYVQIQTFGFGQASIGYRLADQLQGPWSEPVMVYSPVLLDDREFVYSANAHPELSSKGLLITYNVNNFDFGKLMKNEAIYFPKFIRLVFKAE